MQCARCGSTIFAPATKCDCDTAPKPAPSPPPQPAVRLIPTKNMPALVGYYLAIASIVPFVWFLAIPAVLIGGVGFTKADEVGQGKAHAVTAIVVGLGAIVVWGGESLGWWRIEIAHVFGK